MNRLSQDFVYGLRMLRKSPGITILAVVTLALGIGANTAVFSNVNALVLHPFALPDLDRVVAIWETVPKQNVTTSAAAPANFRDWTEQSKSFEHLAAVHGWDANLTGDGVAERVEGYQVTPDFFALLGVAPQFGRPIGAIDFQHGINPVVVISQGFWQRHLGGDAGVVGKNLLLNGQKYTVVGIGGRDLDFPAGADIWTPLDLTSAAGGDRANHYLKVLGRLRKDVSVADAGADLQTIATRLAQQFPNTNADHSVRVVQLAEDATNGTRQFVMVLMGAAVFVLLLACVNVANLQLARVSSRQKEMAVRLGLGATRWQLVRQLLVESTLLAIAGAAGGIVLSGWGMGLIRRGLPPFIVAHVPGLAHLEVDSHVLWFTLAVAMLTGVLAGLAPALRFSRAELSNALKENTRSASSSAGAGRLRTVLVVSEIALALVLLVGAGLMVKGFRSFLTMEMGFDRTQVLTFRVTLPEEQYSKKDQVVSYYDRVIRELRTLPGVESVGCLSSLPSSWNSTWAEYRAEGRVTATAGETPYTLLQVATPDIFSALRVPLLKGRFLSAADSPDRAAGCRYQRTHGARQLARPGSYRQTCEARSSRKGRTGEGSCGSCGRHQVISLRSQRRPDDVCFVRAVSGTFVSIRRPHIGQFAGVGRTSDHASTEDRCRRSRLRRKESGAGDLRQPERRRIFRPHDDGLRNHRANPRRRGNLRGYGLLGSPTHSRDWSTHGDGRAPG